MLEGSGLANLKVGKRGLKTYLEATVFPEGNLYFGADKPDFIHECTGRRPPKTGGACIIKRPALNAGWKAPFSLLVVDERRTPEEIKKAIEESGMLVGLGDWRPEYGRFFLTAWKVEKNVSPSEAYGLEVEMSTTK
ncbi:MAG: hypothetical protein EHM36_14360 [Deltaproteobacteria bacterium]|nr:MAG: hypothetical protein EHM36_14360 [Deltaproteobacteria bacterium]